MSRLRPQVFSHRDKPVLQFENPLRDDQLRSQFVAVEWFYEVVVGAEFECFQQIVFSGFVSQENEVNVRLNQALA